MTNSQKLLKRAGRFYVVVFLISTFVSVVSFSALIAVSQARSAGSQTLESLVSTQAGMQQVSLRLATINPNDPRTLAALDDASEELKASVGLLSADIEAATNVHPLLNYAEERISFWAARIAQNPSDLNLARGKIYVQEASEILTDELVIVNQELNEQSTFLQSALTAGYVVMGLAVLAAIYFLGIMFMSIRSILVWDEQMIESFSEKGKKRVLPVIKVPGARLFPGSTLLADQSRTIAMNFEAQVERQRQLAKKNSRLSDRLQKTVNELVDSREEFARSSQLAAVGKVAGSVSHEINNPVTGVLGYLAFIKKRSNDESLVVWIDKAIKEVERIGRIARSLLVFSRHSATSAPVAFEIGPVVDNVVTLVGPQMREAEIEVLVDPMTNLPQAMGRVDELQQCLLNVLLNARYALLKQPQKKIWVAMRKAGATLEISITDSGPGVPPKVQEHLFQPFYTTKPAGEGSGLGLAVARELMASMGGTIRFDKDFGPGARFILAVPLFDSKKAEKAAKAVEVTDTASSTNKR